MPLRDPETHRAYMARYYEENRDAVLAQQRAHRKENSEEVRAADRARHERRTPEQRRARHLKTAYGITSEQFSSMMAEQGGRCAICPRVFGPGCRVNVDHDHVTGKVRGLLCSGCNRSLAGVENEDFRNKALAYLEAHREAR